MYLFLLATWRKRGILLRIDTTLYLVKKPYRAAAAEVTAVNYHADLFTMLPDDTPYIAIQIKYNLRLLSFFCEYNANCYKSAISFGS